MFILASKSPRRKEIFELMKLDFKVVVSDFDESTIEKPKNVSEFPILLSIEKAKVVAKKYPNDIVVSSDTIVSIDNKILGKPKDYNDAFNMLSLLSNKTHQVITGVCVINNGKIYSFNDIADVTFKKLTDTEIDDYIKTNEPMDKAGAYGIQGIGSKLIKSYNGDFYTIMGFPKIKFEKFLKEEFNK